MRNNVEIYNGAGVLVRVVTVMPRKAPREIPDAPIVRVSAIHSVSLPTQPVTRAARRATRWVTVGDSLASRKARVHRAQRRIFRNRLAAIANGSVDADGFDPTPPVRCGCDARDIW